MLLKSRASRPFSILERSETMKFTTAIFGLASARKLGVIALAGLASGLLGAEIAAAQAAGDPVQGKATFARCGICHTVEVGKNKIGPSLAGVVGRKAGTLAGYNYSTAMAGSGVTWTPAVLDKYLTKPQDVVPGTKMIFPGLPSAADRANIIAYLKKPDAVK